MIFFCFCSHLASKATESTDPDHVGGCPILQDNVNITEKNGVIYCDNTPLVRLLYTDFALLKEMRNIAFSIAGV